MTSTIQMIKVWTIKWAFKNIKVIVIALVVDIGLLQLTLLVKKNLVKKLVEEINCWMENVHYAVEKNQWLWKTML